MRDKNLDGASNCAGLKSWDVIEGNILKLNKELKILEYEKMARDKKRKELQLEFYRTDPNKGKWKIV